MSTVTKSYTPFKVIISLKKAEARKTTILQHVDQKPQLQKDREDEKAEGYVPDEGTRKNPRKTTK